MNYIKSELLKLIKAPFIWVLSSAYLIVFLIIFYQYTLNGNANVIEPLLKDPTNLYSLFIILFSTFFNVFFAVTLGGQVASKEFSNNTIGCLIQNSGRYKGFMAKIALIVIVCFSFIMFLILLGILLGLTVSGKVDNFSFINLLKRFAIGFFSTFLMSLFSMTV